jgi:predicted small secreted protein
MRGIALAALLATLLLAACDTIVTRGPITQSVAETNARRSSGASVAPVAVVSARLSTYGAERPGGRDRDPSAQVWAVVLSGAFPAASCGTPKPVPTNSFGIGGFPGLANCPPPFPRERVLIDALSGATIEVIQGG